jgi:hypothetical protein
MRKSLFNYSFYSHPEIGNFRVWQLIRSLALMTIIKNLGRHSGGNLCCEPGSGSWQIDRGCLSVCREPHGWLMTNCSVTVVLTIVSSEPTLLLANVCREHTWRLTVNKSFAVNMFVVSALPRAAHDKPFAESKRSLPWGTRWKDQCKWPRGGE